MKKLLTLITVLAILCILPLATQAKAEYSTMFDLFQTWNEAYPDYVCGVWTETGDCSQLTVGIVPSEEGDLGKTEILDLIKDDNSVTFVTQKYSKNYLMEIQDYADGFFKRDIGLISTGIYERENVVHIQIHEDYAENEQTTQMLRQFEEEFGDAVKFEFSDAVIVPTTNTPTSELKNSIGTTLADHERFSNQRYTSFLTQQRIEGIFFVSAVMLSLLAAITLITALRMKTQRALRTTDGKTVTQAVITENEIKALVKKEEVYPSAELDERIMQDIKNTK